MRISVSRSQPYGRCITNFEMRSHNHGSHHQQIYSTTHTYLPQQSPPFLWPDSGNITFTYPSIHSILLNNIQHHPTISKSPKWAAYSPSPSHYSTSSSPSRNLAPLSSKTLSTQPFCAEHYTLPRKSQNGTTHGKQAMRYTSQLYIDQTQKQKMTPVTMKEKKKMCQWTSASSCKTTERA